MSSSTVLLGKDLCTKKEKRKEKLKLKKLSTVKSLELTKREFSQRKRSQRLKKRLEAKATAESTVSTPYEQYLYVGDLKQAPLGSVDPSALEDARKFQLNLVIY